MTEKPFNPFFQNWADAQTRFLEAQKPFWDQMAQMMPGGEEGAGAVEELWANARSQSAAWLDTYRARIGAPSSERDGIAHETLLRMMDPSQFMYTGADEVGRTIQRLVEGPEFADLGMLERTGLKATAEWLELRKASATYRMVTAKTWTKAFRRFSEDLLGKTELWDKGPRAILDAWLETANDEMIAMQRTQEFLTAQRDLLRAGMDYRVREREMMEIWCESHSIPSRSEIDDLHKTVYDLRHTVRALQKEVAALKAPRRKAAENKGQGAK